MKKCLFNFLFSANFLLFLSARESLSLSSRVPATELLESGLNSTLSEFEEDVQANVTRRKRNSGGNSPESLLASCQLTNLLLYQALQQQRQANANPLLALATSNPLLQQSNPLANLNFNQLNPLAAALSPNNLGIGPVFPSLSTYLSTSTYVTQLTTTALVTVPLLFGNKPSTTTITRTKVYDHTTSEVKTVTSAITPTIVVPQIKTTSVEEASSVKVTPTKIKTQEAESYDHEYESEDDLNYVQEEEVKPEKKRIYLKGSEKQASQPSSKRRETSNYATEKQESPRKKERRKSTPTQTPQRGSSKYQEPAPTTRTKSTNSRTTPAPPPEYEDYYGSSYGQQQQQQKQQTSPKKKKGNPSRQEIQQDSYYSRTSNKKAPVSLESVEEEGPIEEDPAAVQYPDDYSYYNRRLKRGEQDEEETLPREYLLEPSYDGDYSGNYQKYEKCPPIEGKVTVTVTVKETKTETKTVTKFLKGNSASTPAFRIPSNLATADLNANYGYQQDSYNYNNNNNYPKTFVPTQSSGSNNRRSFRRNQSQAQESSPSPSENRRSFSAASTTPYPTTPFTGDPRAQILKRGRGSVRFTPTQDYEYYNNRG